MELQFETSYSRILEKIQEVDPIRYGASRNYIHGAVTYLSPYISRGVISTRQVLSSLITRGYNIPAITCFVRELCWRDYFQRVAQAKELRKDIRHPQSPVANYEIPRSISHAATGITAIDHAIDQLYRTGYMHNHCRMYTASLACNIAQSHWYQPARWMYYHLLDGDWASNACSWQWVAGCNSHKKYYASQENINRYTGSSQQNTFLDEDYDVLAQMEVPAVLQATEDLRLSTVLPVNTKIDVNPAVPVFIYNYYNLDPLWHENEQGNRVLLLEPAFFDAYPVSKNCIDFMLSLGENIKGLQVYTGSFESFRGHYQASHIHFKEHPFNIGYSGNEEQRDWIAPGITGYYPSFFAYWKKVEKYLLN